VVVGEPRPEVDGLGEVVEGTVEGTVVVGLLAGVLVAGTVVVEGATDLVDGCVCAERASATTRTTRIPHPAHNHHLL